jgi:hypothetical protein
MPLVTAGLVAVLLWFTSGVYFEPSGQHLLLWVSLPIMLGMTMFTQGVANMRLAQNMRGSLIAPLLVLSAFCAGLFLGQGVMRVLLSIIVAFLLLALWRSSTLHRTELMSVLALTTLFFTSYSLLGVSDFLELPRALPVVITGLLSFLTAREVFRHTHTEGGLRILLVLSFAVVTMELFAAISLLPMSALVGAALLCVPLALSISVARSLITAPPHATFRWELFLCLITMMVIIFTARWV